MNSTKMNYLLQNAFANDKNVHVNAITVTNETFLEDYNTQSIINSPDVACILNKLKANMTMEQIWGDNDNINIVVFNEMFFSRNVLPYADMLKIRNQIKEFFKETNCIVFANFLYIEGKSRILTDKEQTQIKANYNTSFPFWMNGQDFLSYSRNMIEFYEKFNFMHNHFLYFANESFILVCGHVISSYKKNTYCKEADNLIINTLNNSQKEYQRDNYDYSTERFTTGYTSNTKTVQYFDIANVKQDSKMYFKGDGKDHVGDITTNGFFDEFKEFSDNDIKEIAFLINKKIYTEICYDIMQGIRKVANTNVNDFCIHVLMSNALSNNDIDRKTPNDATVVVSSIPQDKNSNFPKSPCITIKSDCGFRAASGVFVTKNNGKRAIIPNIGINVYRDILDFFKNND